MEDNRFRTYQNPIGGVMNTAQVWLNEVKVDSLVNTLRETIRIPSPTGSERKMGEYCARRMRTMGFEVIEVTRRQESPNFIGRLSGKKGPGITLCFHAHIDTVPPGDPANWTKDPFGGSLENGYVYGRGACDVKNDIAVMLSVAEILAARKNEWWGNLVLCFASCEETADPAGTQHAIDSGLLDDVDFAVVGEQTECGIVIAHRGGAHFKITVQGESAHSSIADHAGINSIHKMSLIINAIHKHYLPALKRRSHPYLPSPVANVAIIQGGVKPNMVPDHCEMIMDRRMLPDETPEAIRDEIISIINGLRIEDLEINAQVEILMSMPHFETDPQNPHVQRLLNSASEILGSKQKPQGYVAGTDARLFPPAGIPAVVFGPGDFSEAHTANERISVDQLLKATQILTMFAYQTFTD